VRGQRHTPAALHPRERPGIHCTGGWVGLRAGLDRCGKSRPHRDFFFDPQTVQPVASRYTDYATRPIYWEHVPATLVSNRGKRAFHGQLITCGMPTYVFQCEYTFFNFSWDLATVITLLRTQQQKLPRSLYQLKCLRPSRSQQSCQENFEKQLKLGVVASSHTIFLSQ